MNEYFMHFNLILGFCAQWNCQMILTIIFEEEFP